MRVKVEQLRKIINEEAARLHEKGMAGSFGLDDTFNKKGSERKIQAGESPVWKKLKANAGMVFRGSEELRNAVLDQDEDAAMHWFDEIMKYAKAGRNSNVGV